MTRAALKAVGAPRTSSLKILNAYRQSTYPKPPTTPCSNTINACGQSAHREPPTPSPQTLKAGRQSIHSLPSNMDYSKNRINTLLLVPTLVITVTFAAGLYCSAITAVIILWAQLGDPYLMAGVYLVVSKLIWLAIAILVTSAMCLMILLVVFTPLVLPLWFSNPFSTPYKILSLPASTSTVTGLNYCHYKMNLKLCAYHNLSLPA
ncbi:hypothetical protein Patl1_12009 [Pistacia atlantica]|uniref:Uncharacterized protein n=1 Tax=Pistacia atlantica TaxID=434234 RepID=A0ACC1A5R2_9ROSI|nr:hypothetical protein Patl1_12009 [Pistacia atlantica]